MKLRLSLVLFFGMSFLAGCGERSPELSNRGERLVDKTPIPYYALVTCGFNDRHLNVLACFGGDFGTEIELRNGDKYGLYKVHEILQLGIEDAEGLRIDLRKNFELTAQNSSGSLILGVKVIEKNTGKSVFEKKAARFGVISVSN